MDNEWTLGQVGPTFEINLMVKNQFEEVGLKMGQWMNPWKVVGGSRTWHRWWIGPIEQCMNVGKALGSIPSWKWNNGWTWGTLPTFFMEKWSSGWPREVGHQMNLGSYPIIWKVGQCVNIRKTIAHPIKLFIELG